MTQLEQLEAAIENGNGSIWSLCECLKPHYRHAINAYDGSLGSAYALHGALLENMPFILKQTKDANDDIIYAVSLPGIGVTYNRSLARAWLLSVVRALIAKEGKE